jgi:hypothetical protein
LDVQQIVPLPKADSHTVQLRKTAEESRQSRRFEPDLSKYDLTVDGITVANLTKRALAHEAVRAALSKGVSPDQIASLIPPNKWISVEGEIDAEAFREQAADLQAKLGGRYDLRRYFCDDSELFHASGRTYALSNQWRVNTISVVDQLIALMPPGLARYAKASE